MVSPRIEDENSIRNSVETIWKDFIGGINNNEGKQIELRGKFSRVKASEDFAKMLNEIIQK